MLKHEYCQFKKVNIHTYIVYVCVCVPSHLYPQRIAQCHRTGLLNRLGVLHFNTWTGCHCNRSKISTSESDDPLAINFRLTASARQRSDLILRSLGSGLVHDRTAPEARCSLVRSSSEKPIIIALQPEVRRARMTAVPRFIT